MSPEEEAEIQALISGAEDAAARLGWMPIKTQIVMEVVMPNGEREIAVVSSPAMQKNDSMGLLLYAQTLQQGGMLRDLLGFDDD